MSAPDEAALARWHRLESAHFVLTTDQDQPDAERTLRELEEYFAALTSIAFAITPPAQKIPVIGLASAAETQRYLLACFDGIYVQDLLYQPLIVLGAGPHGVDDHIARHELVHYAMRLAYHRSLPLWFAEGMASYFETLAYDRASGEILFGRAGLGRVFELKSKGPLLPVADLVGGGFDATDENDPPTFYAASWLLAHALIHEAPEVFTAHDKALLGGADAREAWAQATPASFRAGADAWLTRYYREHRYEAGRRTPWRAPAATFTSSPVSAADLLTTIALLHTVGRRSQPARADWHRARAHAAADLALQRDPSQLEALQVQAVLGTRPSADRVRPTLRGREQSWVAWMFLANAIPSTPPRNAERSEALARAAALAPDEPMVLMSLATDALEARHREEALRFLERGLAFAPDEPNFARVYLTAMAHDARCGSMARSVQARADNSANDRDWIAAARTVEGCRAQARMGGSP